MSISRKHHYLPQFYLERFRLSPKVGKYSHIHRIEKTACPSASKPAIKDTGCMRDYHTLDYDNEENDHCTVETNLSKIETQQSLLIDSICNNDCISEGQKDSLAEFITSLRYRVPAFKRYMIEFLKNSAGNMFDILMRSGTLPKPPPEIEDLIKESGSDCLSIEISNWISLQFMLKLIYDSNDASILKKMNCQLLNAPSDCYFITCDSPVALYHSDYDSIRPYGVGLMSKNVEVTFPLSKQHIVRYSMKDYDKSKYITEEDVLEYNRRTIIMSDREIYSSEVNQELFDMITLNHDIKTGFMLDNIKYQEGAIQLSRFIPVTK